MRPPSLAGRADLLADVEALLTRASHFGRPGSAPIVWTGVRGVGKTVALLEARDLARRRGFLTVHVTVERAHGLARRTAESVAASVAEADLDRTTRRWARLAVAFTVPGFERFVRAQATDLEPDDPRHLTDGR